MTITLCNRLGKGTHRPRYAIHAMVFGLAMIVALQIVHAKDTLLTELQRAQTTEGSSLVSNDRGTAGVLFFDDGKFRQTRVLPDGVVGNEVRLTSDGERVAFGFFERPSDLHLPTILAVAGMDGTGLQKFPAIQQPTMICWSPRKDRLAFWASKTDSDSTSKASGLWALRVDTGESNLIDSHGSVYGPAWSPDGAKVVYSANGTASVYDTDTKNSRRLANGDHATWSPDGKWIAISKGSAYWLLDPETGEGKVLFKKKNAFTPLWWSPDSQYVAYATRVGVSLSVVEQVDLRVRRIQDGADERVQQFPWKGPIPGIQWVRSFPLLARAKSAG